MKDEESQQASIPKDYAQGYGTIPASANAGGSPRRVVVALAAIALFASGVAVGSSIATTPRGASAYGTGQLTSSHEYQLVVSCTLDGQSVPCNEVKVTPQIKPLSPPSLIDFRPANHQPAANSGKLYHHPT